MVEPAATRIAGRRTVLIAGLIVLIAGFLLGGLTSWAQFLLPAALKPLANSFSGWTMIAAVLVWLTRVRLAPAAILGAISFVTLNIGYVVVSVARGFPTGWILWSVIGLIAGPVVGIAAAALHLQNKNFVAIGAGVLGGILIGDSIRGFLIVLQSTGWFYWTLVAAVGVLFLATAAIGLLRSIRSVALELAVAILTVAGMNFALLLLSAFF
jgi:Family of unknown function (DUF6518)